MTAIPISVISVNFNNKSGLERTIESVLGQDYKNLEYIIIDGGSNDGSEELIQKVRMQLAHWVSEPDRGIYHAMNKGIKASKGEYLLFLNSGDTFYSSNSVTRLLDGNSADLIYGDLLIIANGQTEERRYPERISFRYLLEASLPHPATLIRSKLFDNVGLFREDLKIVSDWDFFIKAIVKYNCTYQHVPYLISNFELDGLSSDPENLEVISLEREKVISKEFALFMVDYRQLEKEHKELQLLKGGRAYKYYLWFKNLFT